MDDGARDATKPTQAAIHDHQEHRASAVTPASKPDLSISISTAARLLGSMDDYADMLQQSVAAGASIGFVQPFSHEEARRFWIDRLVPMLRTGSSVLFEARLDGTVAGTVQLVLPAMPNQVHKADVAKMMVHPRYRRRGVARALMTALVEEARRRGFKMLTLDTRSGDPAQGLYAGFGFEVAGEIPHYAIDPEDPDRLQGTTYMYKWLGEV